MRPFFRKRKTELVKRARQRVASLQDEYPTLVACESLLRQLDYVLLVLEGLESDKSRLKLLTLGILGLREIDEIDSELGTQLSEIERFARRL